MMKTQRFGIEIEMTGITRKQATVIIAEHFGTASRSGGTYYDRYEAKDNKGRTWTAMSDSSINPKKRNENNQIVNASSDYETEVVSPILTYDDIPALQELVRKFKGAGALTDDSCGIHIHIDGANHNPQSLRRLVNFTVARQDLIYEALEIESRGSRWCKKLSPSLLTELKKDKSLTKNKTEQIWYGPSNDGYSSGISHDHYNSTRYHGINLHSYFSKGTVEFRLFNSTLHAGKIKAYIQFCLAISAWAITSEDKIVFRSMEGYTAEQKVTIMRNILTQRLGLYGDEFKTCRLHIMTPLKKKAASNRAAAA